jgi:hypothetical protein
VSQHTRGHLGYGRRMAWSGAPAPPPLGRREALIFLVGLPVALAGCNATDRAIDQPGTDTSATSSPPASSSPTPSPTPAPTPNPRIVQGAALEQGLADLAGATITGTQNTQLSEGQRALLAAVRTGHLDHAAALNGLEATNGPTSAPPASPGPGTVPVDEAIATLVKGERGVARSHEKAALDSAGFPALLWASMAVAANSYASALGNDAGAPTASAKRRPMPALSTDEAIAELVAQLHAVVYGYQLAIGKLPVLGKRHARAVAELFRVRILRERLISILTKRSVKIPVPKSAYVPSVRVHDAASAGKLIAHMQSALLPFCGLFVAAAANSADRKLAIDTLSATARTARSWGAPISAWPGWR